MKSDILHKKEYHVDWGDIDLNKELKLSTLFSCFQDVASEASEKLGFGIESLDREYGVAWVLMKIRVDLLKNPKVGDTISIETWPLEPGKIDYGRDYIVRNQQGEVMIRAISSWVLMDLRQRKISRKGTVPIQYPASLKERAIDEKLKKLKAEGPLDESYRKMIGYSDIDFNGHLNNSKYVDYILDCFSVSEHRNYRIQSIEVHFTNEALPDETIVLQTDTSASEQSKLYIEGFNLDTNKTVFKSKLIIEKR
ncbi:acyl-[acyl-carrier-protein] thioesterase [Virgibacillus halophilus]|uniref:acyl-[acyl-carrier-protein] thioesterase n=1 Tax=Tigheibacillus halophilus TaxID=361280 RepID=UPI0036408403